ncbi:MAG: hypothetical protein ISS87_00485 [Candidatus Pacebacteria bacterium]|nr:hypothetical protein [Candidatus Paceibacterota bacterium]
MEKGANGVKQDLQLKKVAVKKRDDQLQELDRIAKMLVRRDFDLMETKEKRENELKELKETKLELEKAKSSLETKVIERTKELDALTRNLEIQVEERTTELKEKIDELQKMNNLMIGRELKMAELKIEIIELKEKLKALKDSR